MSGLRKEVVMTQCMDGLTTLSEEIEHQRRMVKLLEDTKADPARIEEEKDFLRELTTLENVGRNSKEERG